MEEITSKGLAPGDPVGDLQDPALAAEAAALGGASGRDGGKQERVGSGSGMYRAGGPTTIFGGSGWGPYSEGPLNAVKKSMLNREGLTEESWMHVAAQRTLEINEEWKLLRKAALSANSGLGNTRQRSQVEQEPVREKGASADDMDVEVATPALKRQKTLDVHPRGVYDPQTGLVFCEYIQF